MKDKKKLKKCKNAKMQKCKNAKIIRAVRTLIKTVCPSKLYFLSCINLVKIP